MRTIDITTSQKVSIEYEVSSLRDRFLGYFIDQCVIWGSMILLLLLYVSAFDGRNIDYFVYLVILPIFLFYTLVMEIVFSGQTLGKKAVGTKVVKLSGKEATITDYIIRWSFRMIDVYLSLGAIAAILISSSDKGQRLGGIISNTAVIKLRPSLLISLHDILNIQTKKDYQPKYPEVQRYTEDDMLLMKHVLERASKYPNTAHRQAIEEVVARVKTDLDIDEIPKNRVQFLKTLINDYIVLTR